MALRSPQDNNIITIETNNNVASQGSILALLAALSNPSNHERHTSALEARDNALSASPESYSAMVLQMARIFQCCTFSQIPSQELAIFQETDPTSAMQLQHDPTSWAYLRCMAGLILKNALLSRRPSFVLPTEYVAEIQFNLLQCLTDPIESQIRNITSSILVSVAGRTTTDLFVWPNLIPYLIECCLNGSSHGDIGVHAALGTLEKFCEDVPSLLMGSNMLCQLIPMWIQFLDVPEPIFYREKSLKCLNCYLEIMPQDLSLHLNNYLQKLSTLALDVHPSIRILVCQAIVSLLSNQMEILAPHLTSIVNFMLHAMADTNPHVALEACEFWLTFAAMDDCNNTDVILIVQNALPQLIPLLVTRMVYPDEKKEELLEENKQDEADVEDRQGDIAPLFHKNRLSRGVANDDDDDDEEDVGRSTTTNDDETQEWTLRKCAAASLDTLASMYGATIILPLLLPTLQQGLTHEDPWVREASILALGAVAEGCDEAMSEHLPMLQPYLLQQLMLPDVLPQVKSISCWTLSRYASWMVEQVETGAQPELIQYICEITAVLMLNRSKKVQVAACSALGVYIEHFGDFLMPFIEETLFPSFVKAMYMYHARSFIVLCDTMGILANNLGEPIGERNLPNILIPALLNVWTRHQNSNEKLLLPLMECLACMALAMKQNIQPWSLVIFEKAMSTIETGIVTVATLAEEAREEDSDGIICGTDLLDGMVEGLGVNFDLLVRSSAKYANTFLSILHTLCQSDVPGVRMSAFALIGDLARKSPGLIEAGIPQLMQELIENIDPTHPFVCNNATWAVGEICARCGREQAFLLKPYTNNLLEKLIPLLMGNSSDSNSCSIQGLAENASATMGRLARLDALFVQADLPRFVAGWCEGLARVADITERREAFEGFIMAIHANPNAILAAQNRSAVVAAFLFAIVSWHIPTESSGVRNITSEVLNGQYVFKPFPVESAEIGNALKQLLIQIRNALGQNLDEVAAMPCNVRRLLAEQYCIG